MPFFAKFGGGNSNKFGFTRGASAPLTAPTSLSAVPSTTSVAISFTAPTNNGGLPITNYEYSFNNSSWTALSPVDATSPVTVSGLTSNTGYTVYLRAVNSVGSGPASSGVSFTTSPIFMSATGGTTNTYTSGGFTYKSHKFTSSGTFTVTQLGDTPQVDVLVVAGGGGGGSDRNGGGGAGGFRTTTQTLSSATGYTVTVGAGGPNNSAGSRGGNSSFVGSATFSATGGGHGDFLAGSYVGALSGGSGGGGFFGSNGAAGNLGGYSPPEGYAGGNQTDTIQGGAGGGAGGVGGGSTAGNTAGATNAYETGSNQTYANGGGGGNSGAATSTAPGSGRAGFSATPAQAGVVVIRYRIS